MSPALVTGRTWSITVRGVPKGQPRPRAFARKMGGKFVARVYDAGTAENWKSLVVTAASGWRPARPIENPVSVRIELRLPRPKSLMRRKDPDGMVVAPVKPDFDNAAKAIIDALTQDGWWRDDAQVVECWVIKLYHAKDGEPGAHLLIQEVET